MAIDNAIVWIFSPDLGESSELADYGHTLHDNDITWPSDDRFDPVDASMGEFRRAARQYFKLSADAIPCSAEWLHIADEIWIFIHRDFDGADEALLPARARARLQSLRGGNPNQGTLLP
jgi:hypothetical protein